MHESMAAPSAIVVGVVPNQPDLVVATACVIARRIGGANVHLAYVNPTLIEEDGHEEPLDPDSMDVTLGDETRRLCEHAMQVARDHDIFAQFHMLAGDPAAGLAKCADYHDAMMIVVGTRERGALETIREWINGSVAVTLSHTQSIPVLTVPLAGEYAD